ncbi:3-hydroxyacyl-CoA dehydrogenase [Ornithinibacillus halotolerans]|uniref:3-hydroxybutyryl-CoA dehydrogenase n=1 Tax=Ornithinibacillus halotolerans TaxID=1274357 RepID=A0A916S672_9BACI|nr:3-hydroxyacyl-CoA dehydrogenase [Ornithinibacillus halotolerans]GGA82949.1 3-hydroxybutyryl-CoA dehydrogenase [Ornithinibacillus halotolerans]
MTIKRITVVGAGVMGRGIAYVSALSSFETTLVDISQQQLKAALENMKLLAEKAVAKKKLSKEQSSNLFNNLHTSLDLQAVVKETDFVIEAVPEKRELKKQVLETIDQYAPNHIIIASNTSTISPTELGSYTTRPNQVAAMHFFNPVHRMRLVEIVKGLETAPETVHIIREVAEQMGKETVEVKEFPGFVTSRISAMVGNEAFYMLQEGVASAEDIDKAIKLGLNYPMGPLELGDLVGLDTRLNNLKYLHETLGEKFRPAPLLEQYVKAGRLGRKTGRGVYEYTNEGERIPK